MKFIPHSYQTACIQAIKDKPYLGLLLEMGLG